MKKKDFEKWALDKYPQEFKHQEEEGKYQGYFTWFNFPFWELNGDTTRAVITEFKQQIKE